MNIVFWDSNTKTWKARMEFSEEELLFLHDLIPYRDTAKGEFLYLAAEIQRRNRERDDFND